MSLNDAIHKRTRGYVEEVISKACGHGGPDAREAALVAMRELLSRLDGYARGGELMDAVGRWINAVDELADERDARRRPDEDQTPCSTPSPATVVPPDRETWDILCAYLAGEEHHGSGISEGRLAEILRDRIGWSRDEVRAAWFDAVARGNALIEADHERKRPLIEAEAARRIAEIERRKSAGGPTGGGCSS